MNSAAICIAVVDDEASVRTMLGRLLRLADDYEVADFDCGDEFIASLAMRRPDASSSRCTCQGSRGSM